MSSSNSWTTVEFSVAPSHPSDKDPSLGTPVFANAQHVLAAPAVHARRADHRVVAKDQPVYVNDEQFQAVKTPRRQRLDLDLV